MITEIAISLFWYAHLLVWNWICLFSTLLLEGLAEEDWKIKREYLLQKKVQLQLSLSLKHTAIHTET